MNFDLPQLGVLACVARHGSMTAAAEELSYTPSAISQQIRKLEAEIGSPVLERHARGVTLTESGRLIVARSEAIEAQLRGLRNDLEDLAGARTGQVRLGVFPTFAASILPAVMVRFRADFPGLVLTVKSSRKAPLAQLLDARDIDLALTWDYEWNRQDPSGLEIRHLMTDETVLLVPKSHRLAARSSISLTDLAEASWIIRADGHATQELLYRSARATGFAPKVAVEANDYPEVQAMVAAGMGVSLCPTLATQPLRDDIVVRRVEVPVGGRRIGMARDKRRPSSPAQAALEETLRRVVTELGLVA